MLRWRWWLWGSYVTAWTAALVMPIPQQPLPVSPEAEPVVKFIIAKTLHVGAYVGMTLLSAGLRVPARYRWLLVVLLMGHGTLTELLQEQTGYREGTLRDVGFDNLGVLLGLAASWKWWTAKSEDEQRESSGSPR